MELAFTKIPIPRPASRMTLRLWRCLPSGPQWVYTYAGAVDHVVLGTVMQTVRDLVTALPGDLLLDVTVTGVAPGLLRAVRDDLHALRARGVRPLLRHRPGLRRWRRPAPTPAPAPLLH